jgi:pectate lyase
MRRSFVLSTLWFSGTCALGVLSGGCGSSASPAMPPPTGGDNPADGGHASDTGAGGDVEVIAAVMVPFGFATQYVDPATGGTVVVSGGDGAPATNVYVVHNRKELLDALLNVNSPTYAADVLAAKKEPKVIYVAGTIRGNDLGDGTLADATTYRATPNPNMYDFDLYVKWFDTQYKTDLMTMSAAGDAAATAQLALVNSQPGSARTTFSNNQKSQIQFQVPPNTSLLGMGQDAKLVDGYLSINTFSATFGQTLNSNIIIRNIEFQVPQDLSPAWDPTDTATGNWNARFDGISIVTSRNIWIDHCTFSDGDHLDAQEPAPFNGKHVQRHDGLVDIEDGSDDITLSYNVFRMHDKTTLIGSTGGGTMGQENFETGKENITFAGNLWDASVQRDPLARWGHYHLFDNLYRGDTSAPNYPVSYFIGMGTKSSILSESNVFDVMGGATLTSALQQRAVTSSGGTEFHDVGSFWGDAPFTNFDAIARTRGVAGNTISWTVPYTYQKGQTAAGVRQYVLANAGAGKLDIQAP